MESIEIRCPSCKKTHSVTEYEIKRGSSPAKNDQYDGGYMWSEEYYEWVCPITHKKVYSRWYYGYSADQ